MSDNTSTYYAVRLPSGQLARDLPAAIMQGHPEYKTLPGGQNAWLWGEQRRHEAYQTLHAIAEHLKPWGLTDLLKAHASVVMVRTTVEILDGDRDPEPPDAEQPAEPRRWEKAIDVPEGVAFQTADTDRAFPVRWTREGSSCTAGGPHGDGNRYSLCEVDSSWGGKGFIEIMPEESKPEPRTWKSAADIPPGVLFVAAAGNEHYTRTKSGARTDNLSPLTEGHHYTTDALDHMHPEGFSEVAR